MDTNLDSQALYFGKNLLNNVMAETKWFFSYRYK